MKKEDKPESARSQLNTCVPTGAILIYANPENPKASIRATNGRPFLSIYANIFGACPISARAEMVRVLPYVLELPTLKTLIKITTFITDGNTFIPAF